MISSSIPEFLLATSLSISCFSPCVVAVQKTDELSIEFLEFIAEVECVAEADCAHPFVSETPVTSDTSGNMGDINSQYRQNAVEQEFTDD